MKSFLLAAVLVAACGKSSDAPVIEQKALPPAPPPPRPAPTAPGVDLAKVAALIPAGMETITRFGPRGPVLDMLGSLADAATSAARPPCYAALTGQITDLFAFANVHTKRSVLVVTGALPRKDVEACVAQIFTKDPYKLTVGADGDLATFTLAGGEPIYAAFRDGAVVAGDKQVVTDVLTAARATEPWAQRLAALPATFQIMEMASVDPIATKLFGVPTTGYDAVGVTERPAKAHVVVHAATPADAKTIADKLAAGTVAWGIPVSPALAGALAKLPVAVHGNDVAIEVEQALFAGIADEELAKLGQALTGAE